MDYLFNGSFFFACTMSERVCKLRKWNLKQFVHISPKFSVFLWYFFFIFQKKQLLENYISKETPKQIEKTIYKNKFKILCRKETFFLHQSLSFCLKKKNVSFVRNFWVEKENKFVLFQILLSNEKKNVLLSLYNKRELIKSVSKFDFGNICKILVKIKLKLPFLVCWFVLQT